MGKDEGRGVGLILCSVDRIDGLGARLRAGRMSKSTLLGCFGTGCGDFGQLWYKLLTGLVEIKAEESSANLCLWSELDLSDVKDTDDSGGLDQDTPLICCSFELSSFMMLDFMLGLGEPIPCEHSSHGKVGDFRMDSFDDSGEVPSEVPSGEGRVKRFSVHGAIEMVVLVAVMGSLSAPGTLLGNVLDRIFVCKGVFSAPNACPSRYVM